MYMCLNISQALYSRSCCRFTLLTSITRTTICPTTGISTCALRHIILGTARRTFARRLLRDSTCALMLAVTRTLPCFLTKCLIARAPYRTTTRAIRPRVSLLTFHPAGIAASRNVCARCRAYRVRVPRLGGLYCLNAPNSIFRYPQD